MLCTRYRRLSYRSFVIGVFLVLLALSMPSQAQSATCFREQLKNPDLEITTSKSQPLSSWLVWPTDAVETRGLVIDRVTCAGRDGKDAICIQATNNTGKSVYIVQNLPAATKLLKGTICIGSIWVKGDLAGAIKITSITPSGREAYLVGGGNGVSFTPTKKTDTSKWRMVEFRFTPQNNYPRLKFVFSLSGNGTLWVDQISFLLPQTDKLVAVAAVSKPKAKSKPKPRAKKPPKPKQFERVAKPKDLDWSYGAMWKRKTPTRETLCLNGYWRFQPVSAKQNAIPRNDWGFLRVPGCWYSGFSWMDQKSFRVYGSDGEGDIKWNGREFRYWRAGWFQRSVDVPADWAGKRIVLKLNQVDFSAKVYWNGKLLGKAQYVNGAVLDATALARPGKTNQISIRVAGPHHKVHYVAGINGDIYLQAMPKSAHIEFDHVRTDASVGIAKVYANINSNLDMRNVTIICDILQNGKAVATWEKPVTELAANKATAITIDGSMKGIDYWDLTEKPALYSLRLRMSDATEKTIDEVLVEGIGFRDFRIKGNQFNLNSTTCRLRPTVQPNYASFFSPYVIREFFTNMRTAGLNAVYVWMVYGHGSPVYDLSTLLTEADRHGIAVYCALPSVGGMKNLDTKAREKALKEWRKWVAGLIRRYRNHPSVLMYVTNFCYPLYDGTGQDPSKMDGIYLPKGNLAYQEDRVSALKSIAYIKKLDPTRPVVNHDGCNSAGDVFAQNNYLGWTPLQEKEEWLSLWADKCKKPLVMGEYGEPLLALAFGKNHRGPSGAAYSERMASEFTAIYLGPDAYRQESDEYVHDTTEKHYKGGNKYGSSYWYFCSRPPKMGVSLLNLHVRNVNRAWRTYGISGGMVGWHAQQTFAARKLPLRKRKFPVTFSPSPRAPGLWANHRIGDNWRIHELWNEEFWKHYEDTGHLPTYIKAHRPLLAYIGGQPERFTAKDHHFFPADKVQKQIIIINDNRRDITVSLDLNVKLGGKDLQLNQGKSRQNITLKPGEIRKVPFTFAIPSAIASKTTGRINLVVKQPGGKDIVDTFAFEAFPRARAEVKGKIALYDPAGRSASVLKEIACPYTPVQEGDDLSVYDMLVVGSKALPESVDESLPFNIQSFLNVGGKVLFLEQTPKAMFYRFGFRVTERCARQAFIGDNRHPILDGLDDADLANWNGSGTATDPYPVHKEDFSYPRRWWNGFYHARYWKWGNYGSVATTLIEKPHMPDFAPLVQSEFDLQYTPLLEWTGPKGRAIFFQFDVSSRTATDPVALLLLARTLEYMDGAIKISPKPTFYAGGEKGSSLLKEMRITFGDVKDVAKLPSDALLILGGKNSLPTGQIKKFVRRGGRVFFLPSATVEDIGWVSPSLKTVSVNLSRTGGLPDDWFFRGLTLADVHWRGFLDRQCLKELPKSAQSDAKGLIARIPFGKGSFLFCQIDPRAFDVVNKTFLRQSQKNAYSLLSRLLFNAGAGANSEVWTYQYKASTPLDGIWRIRKDDGKNQAGVDVDESKWRKIYVPGTWESQLEDYRNFDGTAWYRKRFVMPTHMKGQRLVLDFVVDDFDIAYFNGKEVGHTDKKTNPKDYWKTRRRYPIPNDLIRFGKENVIAVKVTDVHMSAGITGMMQISPVNTVRAGSVYLTDLDEEDDPYRYSKW